MKFRTKLFIAFVSIAAVSSLVGLFINQIETKEFVFAELQSKVKTVAASAAQSIDPSQVAQIKTAADEKLPAYAQVRDQLLKIRNANRRDDVYIKYIYTIWPDPADPHKFKFGVDAEESEKEVSRPGTDNPGATDDLLFDHMTESYSHGEMIKDPWGTWLTGYAPILDSSGNYVGTLGVDVSADLVNAEMNRLMIYSLVSFGVSLLLALVLANFLAQRVSRELVALMKATEEIGKGDFSYRIDVKTHDEFGSLAKAMNKMTEGLEENERLKSGFAHYVSQHVLEKIIKEKGAPQLGGVRRKITVLFSDIRNFTHLAETMPPEQVVALLNEYFKAMIQVIFKHSGMLDKLIGDGIMAEFGAPLEDAEQEKHAVRAAVEMQSTLKELCEKWKKEGKPEIELGIGVHTGEAIIGTIGSEQRMEFTAIGDTVNIASRLEAVTKEGHYHIIVSEATYKALYGEFEVKHIGLLTLPGKELPVSAYAVLGKKEEAPSPTK